MNKKNLSDLSQFEIQWLHKLRYGLRKINRQDLYDKLISKHSESVKWTKYLVETLKAELSKAEINDVMSSCACLVPKNNLKFLKREYQKSNDIKSVHKLLQEYFEEMISEYKKLDKSQMQYLRDNNMGMAGKLEGNIITVKKIPKEFHKYFQTNNKIEKRYYYCHCPRIREALRENAKPIDKNYCYCGAGFYKDLWEFILERPVEVKVEESLLQGDEHCKIKIKL